MVLLFWISYEGLIRAGYVIGDIGIAVDNEAQIITITLPEFQVFSNEITDCEVVCDDNFFNHIDPVAATDLVEEAQQDELDEALANGLGDEARSSAEDLIRGILAELSDYEVVFAS